MVKKRKSSLKKKIVVRKKSKSLLSIFGQDIQKHFVYTLFILLLAVSLTTVFWKTIATSLKTEGKNNDFIKESYEEKGSPFDKDINKSNDSVIFHGDRSKKQIALTFDAEMTFGMKEAYLSHLVNSSYDKQIIETLKKTNTKATLFLTGMWIELYPKETEDLSSNQLFELGSHSYTDSSFSGECYGLKKLNEAEKIEELGTTERLLKVYGHIDNILFRFPGGCYSPEDIKLVNQAGDMVVHWDVVGDDGFNENSSTIVNNVLNKTQNGSIIVLHMNGAPTAPKTSEALPEIISKLKEKGFEFVKISELLNLPEEKRL